MAIAVCSIIASRANVRFGGRAIATLGFLAITLGAVWIAASFNMTSTYLLILPGFLIIGVGNGFTGVTNTIASMAGVSRERQGTAAGLTNTSQRLGQAIGLAILATIATGHVHALESAGHDALSAQLAGYRLGVLVAAGIALVGAVLAFTLIPRRAAAPLVAEQVELAPVVGELEQAEAPS
jgi:MFS family permease